MSSIESKGQEIPAEELERIYKEADDFLELEKSKGLPAKDWISEFDPEKNNAAAIERAFGNYNSGRWAWELLNVRVFETPILAKGSLGLWDFEGKIP